ncbi:hypothetical protein O0L34_g4860 [Tuta absoluta]|nr:hypothetical protein O0L34_g4860 [Tuta absoluta]
MVWGHGCARWALQRAALVACLFVGTLAPERVEPCSSSSLCSCRAAHMSCIAVPLHRFPEWPRIELQHLDISMSNLEIIPESALDGLRLQTLVLVANKLHHIEQHALSSMAATLASLDLGYNEFTEIPQQGLRDLKVLNWLNLQNNNIAQLGTDVNWHHLEETLTSLSLSNNQITQLKSQALSSLYHLVQLDVEGNHLRFISTDAFPSSLTILKLSNNFLHEISCDLLSNLPRLQSVHLRHNSITFSKNSTCSDNKTKKIEKLDLSNNKVNDTTEIFLLREVQIRQIILDFNELTIIPKLVYVNNRVERFSVSFNKLSYIHRDVFASLKNSLERFEVEHNKLSQLPESLAQVVRLRHLSLAYNRLEEAPSLPPRIQTLSLAGNFLTAIPSTLQTLEPGSIRYLDLSYNRISNLLPNEFLDWSTSLGTINLRGNRISQIYKNVFPATMPVKEINLSFNDLYYVHPQSFSNVTGSLHVIESSATLFSGYFPFEIDEGLENLGWLAFDNNDFHILKLSDVAAFPYLKYLNLDYNRIVDIVVNSHNISIPLSDLRVAYNFIGVIHSKTFANMPDLRNLDLSYNRINNLTKYSFTNLPNLRYLSLAGNIIDSMEAEALANLPRLEVLELQGNNFTYLSLSSFYNVSSEDITFTFNVSRNHIRYIDGEAKLPVNIFDGSYNDMQEVPNDFFIAIETSVRQIILSHNKLIHVSSEAFDIVDQHSFRPLISLRSLHLMSWSSINHSTFRLSNITSSIPSLYKLLIDWTDDVMDTQLHGIDARNLRYVEIRGANLRRVSDEAFAPFAESQEIFIRITRTSLTKLPTAFMKHLGQIPQLGVDISYNQLTSLNPAIFYPNFTSWSHVATKLLSGGLILTGNPLRCECELAWLGAWLRRWLQENEAGAELRRAVRSATCKDLQGRRIPLLQLRADEAECHASALSSDAQPHYSDLLYLVVAIWTLIFR